MQITEKQPAVKSAQDKTLIFEEQLNVQSC